jgi:hypothetical protein
MGYCSMIAESIEFIMERLKSCLVASKGFFGIDPCMGSNKVYEAYR